MTLRNRHITQLSGSPLISDESPSIHSLPTFLMLMCPYCRPIQARSPIHIKIPTSFCTGAVHFMRSKFTGSGQAGNEIKRITVNAKGVEHQAFCRH
ncbi:hypothetical protein Moror_3051 [Moniliophthora roreri MCA 2997]|uniref:Uncharacterized protein n=1 Tax=Moniliophthora roreri (strain MCA 2997) TaxID=1381753 RepID=V2WPB0_MONRO|nr:hypothetical protein Moror_3051 [Moniliophthora roreri MCA 2997]